MHNSHRPCAGHNIDSCSVRSMRWMRSAAGRRTLAISTGLVIALVVVAVWLLPVRGFAAYLWGKLRGGYSLAERLERYGPPVASRLQANFKAAGLAYPPHELAYVVFKDTRTLELYGRMAPVEPWRFVKPYAVLGASGSLGPKLAEGDRQVPEGLYRVEYLNPNSRFHLSLRLNYPNEFDKRMAQADGRTRLGGDIMIHGGSASIGCLAVGDRAAEDLFVLAALVSEVRVRVLISPTDFRRSTPVRLTHEPPWLDALYAELHKELQQFHRGM